MDNHTGTPLDALLHEVRVRREFPSPETCRQIRERAGVSGHAFARAVGVDQSTLWGWETGAHAPRPALAQRWLAAVEALAAEAGLSDLLASGSASDGR